MSHCDPRRHRRAAKMKDLARASVSGASRYRSSKNVQQSRSRTRRAKLESLTQFPAGLACSGADECECAFCEYDDTASIVVKGYEHQWWRTSARDHNNPGYRMAEKKLFELDGEFDPWFSWLKRNMPDTLAGRHLLDHIVGWVWCGCVVDAKHNYKGCTCKQQSVWRNGAPGDYWNPRANEPNINEAQDKLLEFDGDVTRWQQWLDSSFAADASGQSRRAQLRHRIWCDYGNEPKVRCRCHFCYSRWYRKDGHKAAHTLRAFIDCAEVTGEDSTKLVDEIQNWMELLGVEVVKTHPSGDYLIDDDDPNFVRIYRSHVECSYQFVGARYDPAGSLRWRAYFNTS